MSASLVLSFDTRVLDFFSIFFSYPFIFFNGAFHLEIIARLHLYDIILLVFMFRIFPSKFLKTLFLLIICVSTFTDCYIHFFFFF